MNPRADATVALLGEIDVFHARLPEDWKGPAWNGLTFFLASLAGRVGAVQASELIEAACRLVRVGESPATLATSPVLPDQWRGAAWAALAALIGDLCRSVGADEADHMLLAWCRLLRVMEEIQSTEGDAEVLAHLAAAISRKLGMGGVA